VKTVVLGHDIAAPSPADKEWAQARHREDLEMAWKRLPKLHRPGFASFLNRHILSGCPLHRA
jgi:hypothetical protein